MRESLRWIPLGSAGGFSGARIWRGEDDGEPLLALKCWPHGSDPERLGRIHGWMNTAAHRRFVPSVLGAADGSTFIVEEGRIWELAWWMPGTADFRANPSAARLANACAALAELHRAWKPTAPTHRTCPAVLRRLSLLAEWREHCDEFSAIPDPLLLRAAAVARRLVEPAERALQARLAHPAIVQPCLCDVWHDHVLFSGEAVSGIVDYGAMKVDHVAVDLARLLGDLVGEDDVRFERGLAAFSTCRMRSCACSIAPGSSAGSWSGCCVFTWKSERFRTRELRHGAWNNWCRAARRSTSSKGAAAFAVATRIFAPTGIAGIPGTSAEIPPTCDLTLRAEQPTVPS